MPEFVEKHREIKKRCFRQFIFVNLGIGAIAQFVNFMVLQGCLDIGNGFSRGEAVAMIGSSEPIIVTEEECGQESSCQQNHTDLLDLLYLVSIIPNRSDT